MFLRQDESDDYTDVCSAELLAVIKEEAGGDGSMAAGRDEVEDEVEDGEEELSRREVATCVGNLGTGRRSAN